MNTLKLKLYSSIKGMVKQTKIGGEGVVVATIACLMVCCILHPEKQSEGIKGNNR